MTNPLERFQGERLKVECYRWALECRLLFRSRPCIVPSRVRPEYRSIDPFFGVFQIDKMNKLIKGKKGLNSYVY